MQLCYMKCQEASGNMLNIWHDLFTNRGVYFTNWMPGQPDNRNSKGQVENHLHLHGGYDWKWNDAHYSALLGYICEKQQNSCLN